MGSRVGGRTLGKRLQKQRVVFLRRKTRHAAKQKIVLSEALPSPPLLARGLRASIVVGWNAVRDDATPSHPVKAFQAKRYFLADGDGNDPTVECVTLNPPHPSFNLALRQVVDRMQMRSMLEKQKRWQSVTKHVQMGVDNIRTTISE